MSILNRALLLVFSGLILPLSTSFAQATATCQRAFQLVKTAEQHHVAPPLLDDPFSEMVFDNTLRKLDAQRLLFSSHDRELLAPFRHTLDEEVTDQSCSFVSTLSRLYQEKLLWADSLLHRFQGETFDLNRTDSLAFRSDGKYDNRELPAERWKKQIHLQMLLSCLPEDNSAMAAPPLPDQWDSVRALVINREICRVASYLHHPGGVEQYVGDAFLKALASAYDPHTAYFTLSEGNEFQRMVSDEALAYGFQLDKNKEGAIEIVGIAPGSPAWNSGELNEGDIVLGVSTPQGEVKDFSCITLEAVARFLSGDIDEASFRIHKRNGQHVTIRLFKEKISVEENAIQSFVLSQRSQIGYLYLPSFYANEQSNFYTSRGCAQDVAKELIKLKQENIEGLIIDLRNNGGGSMSEAVQLAGLFVDYGAVSIIDSRDQSSAVLKDMHRGTVYDGPLVILLNTFSASASELFAAALQDHKRALVVGSPSFGKSTAQQVLPLGDLPSDGFLKLTTGKFYRITGESHQKKGVQPDIFLPDWYEHLNVREKDYLNALDIATIDKKTYYPTRAPLPLEALQTRSASRVAQDSAFYRTQQVAPRLAKLHVQQTVPLHYHHFRSYYATRPSVIEKITESTDTIAHPLSVQNPRYSSELNLTTTAQQAINERVRGKIRGDRHIKEAYHITNDLIELTKP